jgi:hypothetical protein
MKGLLVVLLLLGGGLRAEGLLPVLTESQRAAARRAIEEMKQNPRGPYQRIKWFCKDGSTQPVDGSCAAAGGGVQHGDLSDAARQLHEWGLHVGTVLADNLLPSFSTEQFIDAPRDYHRLKELVLEKYLTEIDQGWIYRKAVSYRGARQIEDEERAGRYVLTRLLSNPKFLARNYYLAQQLVEALPHGVADSNIKRIRNLAAEAAAADSRFQSIRAKIHSYPGAEDLETVTRFLETQNPPERARPLLKELIALLQKQQDPSRWLPMLQAYRRSAAGAPVAGAIDELDVAFRESGGAVVLEKAAALSLAIKAQVTSSTDGARNLQLLDLNNLVLGRAFEWRRKPQPVSRLDELQILSGYLRLATGAGLLSDRQWDALKTELAGLADRAELAPADYRAAIRYLSRAVEWCRATVNRDFGPLTAFYAPVEPAAAGFVDHLLRSSIALPLTSHVEVLSNDADRAAGIRHSVLSRETSGGVVGLNPGIAVGKLAFLAGEQEPVDPRGIYVIPETAADLKPMAGILTLDSGNQLSHAQLLAANLGIPNAVVPSSLKPALVARQGKEVFFAVTPRGVVILKEVSALTPQERKLWASSPAQAPARIELDTHRLRLDDKRLRKLTEVGAADSGVICGPKAANLGMLAATFPDKVAEGWVIPFGVFHEHINRVLDNSGKTLLEQIGEMAREAERLRAARAEPAVIQQYCYPRLERIRRVIENMPLLATLEAEVRARVRAGTGYYVRSDTNAEDLPQFTGAGLNLTLPNEVGVDNILKAIRRVWASPFTERAYDWRSRAIRGAERIYPSVIIMRAVANDKSGVIATTDLETGDMNYVTVNASEGVSAVVDGGVAESLLLAPDGRVRLLQQCRATYRKTLAPGGGFQILPALGGDVLLEPPEIAQIRALVAEVKAKYPPAKSESGAPLPWDIEFGFEKGQLRLFQIRPLARFQELSTLNALARLEAPQRESRSVKLSEPVLAP